MKVKFLGKSENLPLDLVKLGYSSRVELHLVQDEEYTVYGILIWRSVTHYLIIRSGLSLPDWVPAGFFEVSNPQLPANWYFRYLGENDPSDMSLIMGYQEIGLDETHRVGLIEQEVEAIRIFLMRKREIDESEF